MRLLDRLFGKKAPEFAERIWITTARKFDDLVVQVRQCQSLGGLPVVVTHFPATQQRLLDAFDTSGATVLVVSSAPQFPAELPEASTPREAILLLSSETIPRVSLSPPAGPTGGRSPSPCVRALGGTLSASRAGPGRPHIAVDLVTADRVHVLHWIG